LPKRFKSKPFPYKIGSPVKASCRAAGVFDLAVDLRCQTESFLLTTYWSISTLSLRFPRPGSLTSTFQAVMPDIDDSVPPLETRNVRILKVGSLSLYCTRCLGCRVSRESVLPCRRGVRPGRGPVVQEIDDSVLLLLLLYYSRV
jgi:hypothetical protein